MFVLDNGIQTHIHTNLTWTRKFYRWPYCVALDAVIKVEVAVWLFVLLNDDYGTEIAAMTTTASQSMTCFAVWFIINIS